MRLPKVVQELLCHVGRHSWRRGRRVGGFLRRSCRACGARAEQNFPGGGWKTVATVKRVRRKALKLQPVSEEQSHDAARGLGPL